MPAPDFLCLFAASSFELYHSRKSFPAMIAGFFTGMT